MPNYAYAQEPFTLIQTKRVTVEVSGSSTEEVTITWDDSFPDTNYTLNVVVKSDAGALGSSLRLRRVTAITTSSATASVTNDNVSSLSGTVHAIAIHDDLFNISQ